MMYQGSEAYAFDDYARRPLEQERHAPFGVVRGEGRDAAARQGVSFRFVRNACLIMAVGALFLVLAVVRVRLSVLATSQLLENRSMTTTIESVTEQNDELMVARSSLMSATRIDRIATQNYGMVIPASSETIAVHVQSTEDNEKVASEDARVVSEGDTAQSQQ